MSEIKRKKGESFDSFMRRVKRRWQQSGKILQAKKVRYFVREPSKSGLKKSALIRKKISEKRAYLEKMGRLDEVEPKKFGRN